MSKKKSLKFWITFWSLAILLLAGFYSYLQIRNHPGKTISAAIGYIPWLPNKEEYKSIGYFADYFLKNDNQERTFMILFQNNMELRPGGGYIGSFGILKMKNGKVEELQTHDLSNFDARVPDGIEPPYPMKETLKVTSWKMRDSNWSPDFATNAQKADYFYHLGQGQEQFDGIIAVNTVVLTSFLKATGPISLPDYPGTYDSENAILALEYQVEKGFDEQGIARGDRKSVMNELADSIIQKVFTLNSAQKLDLAKIILSDLNNKDIQLYFKDAQLENQAGLAGWSGDMNQTWNQDYLMMADANLGSFKSDYYVKRSFDYTIDLTGDAPSADLKITYNHTAKQKDWMTKDYQTYLRVFVPIGAWLKNSSGLGDIKFGDELGKKYFGSLFTVPLGQTKTVEFSYALPQNFNAGDYNLLIQKESGLGEIPGRVTVIDKNGSKSYDITLAKEWKLK